VAKILVVDDDDAVQATIRLLLERAGHSVMVADDGRKGLAIFEAGDFDLLCLDIFLPGMDGIETMRRVHQQRPRVPVIVISGRPILSDLGKVPDFLTMATKLGAVCSLQKAVQAVRAAGRGRRLPRGRQPPGNANGHILRRDLPPIRPPRPLVDGRASGDGRDW
jgi:CheY-like chemotaxis protein